MTAASCVLFYACSRHDDCVLHYKLRRLSECSSNVRTKYLFVDRVIIATLLDEYINVLNWLPYIFSSLTAFKGFIKSIEFRLLCGISE